MGLYIGNTRYKVMSGTQRSTFITEKRPYDYAVEWIGTNENVYFDTGFVPNTYDITIKAKLYYVGYTDGTSWISWFSAYTNETSSTYRIIRNRASNTSILMYNGRQAGNGNVSVNITQNTLYEIEFTPTRLRINNASYTNSMSGTPNSRSMQIFNPRFKGRMYYFQMYKDDELVMDLIPVVKDNVGCIYDRVSENIINNSLTGTVLIGPKV